MGNAQAELAKIFSSLGIARFGVAPLQRPLTIAHYQSWLESDHHGEMEYLKRHLPQKENPQALVQHATHAIVVAVDYGASEHQTEKQLPTAKVLFL